MEGGCLPAPIEQSRRVHFPSIYLYSDPTCFVQSYGLGKHIHGPGLVATLVPHKE